jgi:hypothetical protein
MTNFLIDKGFDVSAISSAFWCSVKRQCISPSTRTPPPRSCRL